MKLRMIHSMLSLLPKPNPLKMPEQMPTSPARIAPSFPIAPENAIRIQTPTSLPTNKPLLPNPPLN